MRNRKVGSAVSLSAPRKRQAIEHCRQKGTMRARTSFSAHGASTRTHRHGLRKHRYLEPEETSPSRSGPAFSGWFCPKSVCGSKSTYSRLYSVAHLQLSTPSAIPQLPSPVGTARILFRSRLFAASRHGRFLRFRLA